MGGYNGAPEVYFYYIHVLEFLLLRSINSTQKALFFWPMLALFRISVYWAASAVTLNIQGSKSSGHTGMLFVGEISSPCPPGSGSLNLLPSTHSNAELRRPGQIGSSAQTTPAGDVSFVFIFLEAASTVCRICNQDEARAILHSRRQNEWRE